MPFFQTGLARNGAGTEKDSEQYRRWRRAIPLGYFFQNREKSLKNGQVS
jgi:hypothetical protein